MNTELIRRCELLVKNRKAIQSAFRWDSETLSLAGSSFYVGLDMEADTEKLKACENILKRKAGIFSEYIYSFKRIKASLGFSQTNATTSAGRNCCKASVVTQALALISAALSLLLRS